MAAVARDTRNRGLDAVTLWILDSNERARRFYESLGCRTDGKTKTDTQLADTPLREERYRIAVPEAAVHRAARPTEEGG